MFSLPERTTLLLLELTTGWNINTPGQTDILARISRSFLADRIGFWQIALATLFLLLILLITGFTILAGMKYYRKKWQRIGLLETLKNNYPLKENQEKYLEALVERFKNSHPHDPEVATEYLEKFLIYTIQQISQGPDQRLRRGIHAVPNLNGEEEIFLVKSSGEGYKSLPADLTEQKDRYLTLRMESKPKKQLTENETVEISVKKDGLIYRGKAKIRSFSGRELIIHLPQGLHFEQDRDYQRVEVNNLTSWFTVQLESGDTVTRRGYMVDLSIAGCRLKIPGELEFKRYQHGILEFQLPDTAKLETRAEIERIKKPGGETELGLNFIWLNPPTRERIANYLRSLQN